MINPINRCPTVVAPAEEAARFERDYVSLFALVRQRRRHFILVKKELANAGVAPALDPEKIGATFYRKCEIECLYPDNG